VNDSGSRDESDGLRPLEAGNHGGPSRWHPCEISSHATPSWYYDGGGIVCPFHAFPLAAALSKLASGSIVGWPDPVLFCGGALREWSPINRSGPDKRTARHRLGFMWDG
jgi:hypothetical protein